MAEVVVRFDERAVEDVRGAVEWYRSQREGVGGQFVEALDATVERIGEHPRMFPAIEGDIRRALTRKFPYSVYYRLEDDAAVVLGVFHTRRAENVLQERLEEGE